MLGNQTIDSPIDKYWNEDYNKDSGYLQSRMPSPADGIFISEVSVGDKIKAGDLFGRVLDPVSGRQVELYAEKDGMIFLLRTMVRVKIGDALGGIMPIGTLNEKVIYE